MKAIRAFVFLTLIIFSGFSRANAQSDTAIASERALLFADSLLTAFRYSNWSQYIEMSYPGVIKYYGGKKGFQDYVQRARSINNSITEEPKETTELMQLLSDMGEWQCVIRKIRHTKIDGKKASIISYMVGQSKDDGITWKYFDVAFNSVENVIYIMPDIFDTLAIPQRQIVYDKDEVVKNQP